MKVYFQIAECSLSYAKIMQIERNESLLSNCRVQLILCKDNANHDKDERNLLNSFQKCCFVSD